MGFFDSFEKSFNEESQKFTDSRHSNYETVKQKKSSHFNELNRQNDSVLLGKINSIFTSSDDKDIIGNILKSRGYKKINGTYDKW